MLTTLLRFVAGRDDRLRYSARIEQAGGAFVVTFRDFPHIRATGESADAAKESAIDSLLYAFEDCLYREISIPRASKRQNGEQVIEVPVEVSRQVRLLHDKV